MRALRAKAPLRQRNRYEVVADLNGGVSGQHRRRIDQTRSLMKNEHLAEHWHVRGLTTDVTHQVVAEVES